MFPLNLSVKLFYDGKSIYLLFSFIILNIPYYKFS